MDLEVIILYFIKDESIQSFIFRVFILNGVSEFNSIISIDGYWLVKPNVTKDFSSLFTRFDDGHLWMLMQNSGVGSRALGVCDNPAYFIDEMRSVFYGIRENNKPNCHIPIAYCKRCISESIKENGFGYLKYNWLYDNICASHDTPLTYLSARRRSQSLKALLKVYRGEKNTLESYSRQYLKNRHLIFNGKNEMEIILSGINEKISRPYYIMPCLMYLFNKIFSHCKYEDERHKNSISYGCYHELIKDIDHNAFLNNLDVAIKIFMIGQEKLTNFLYLYSESVNFKFGFNQCYSFSEVLRKKKGANCSKCIGYNSHSTCPKMLLIQRFDLSDK
ncbi:hypothetical protein DJ55_4074 [Yersinia pseudotuberculosis]|nr:hypothetical protein DJ55_4074 [Yersinia pseudotuberculosis]CNF51688.1 Uncharacterised protein [Yersinia enterocolitica]